MSVYYDDDGRLQFEEDDNDDLQSEESDDPDQLEFDEEWDDYDDNPDDDEYGDDDDDTGDGYDDSALDTRDVGDDYEPEWWQEGMPDDWWDFYGDDYEVDEFEIAIDY